MAKLYSKHPNKEQISMNPKKETIDFLLNYSKALRIVKYDKMKFEALLN
ncbi:hypothetical protein [Oceanihabitans sediminis]|nr:hypothetical protein [Oceanihabitans sediminis]MDX1277558.1 hypothetical protein [Oceanihabitans sediminis]MDX1773455.1 hypothetical protein [Oceanihabitans sediminis]RBP32910.1 hypothetical protein DFR65_102246 [Oceanihabitans sediminis]